jgi:hypothetical protein
VEQGGDDGTLISARSGNQGGDFKEMIDVGLLCGALPALAGVPLSRDVSGLDDEKWINRGRNWRAR